MRRKTKVVAAVVLVGLAGAIATVAAQGHRDWRSYRFDRDGFHGGGMGLGVGPGTGMGDGQGGGMQGADMAGRRGMFGRDLSKDEFDGRLRERFARLDKNGDNVLDASEIEAAMSDQMRRRRSGDGAGGPVPNTPALAMLRRLGADKDGKLTRQAFLDRIKAQFADADLDNDGRITDADLPPMLRGRGLITTENLKTSRLPLFRFLGDVEARDGAVTFDAVSASATRRFDRMDRNKDGVVDQTDFDALRKDMTEYQIKRFVHRYGADKDGKVTKEQFFAKESQRFAEADINGDGVVDRTESGGRPGFGQRMRERFMGRPRGQDGGPERGPMSPPVPPKQ